MLPSEGAPKNPGTVGVAHRGGQGRLRSTLGGFRYSIALVAVALLGCVALIALGAVCSLLWEVVAGR